MVTKRSGISGKDLETERKMRLLLDQLLKFEWAHELMVVLHRCRFPDLERGMLVI